MRRFAVLAGLLGLWGLPAQAQAADGFQGPDASMTREEFFDVWDVRHEQARLWQARWFGQHEDGSHMWIVYDSMGEEYAASCLVMAGVDYDNYSDGGPGQVECGVSPTKYANVHPASWPEPVRVKVAQLSDALEKGMTEHMPYAPVVAAGPSPVWEPATGSDGTAC